MMTTPNQDLQEESQEEGPSFSFTQKLLHVLSPRQEEGGGEENKEEGGQLAPSAAAETPMATEARMPVTVTPLKREAPELPQEQQQEEAQHHPPPEKRQKVEEQEAPTPAAAAAAAAPIPNQTTAILDAIKVIPAGQTRTYSEVAFIAGYPRNASAVGKTIRGLDLRHETSIPWHRVVGQDGKLRPKHEGEEQLRRLITEGARPDAEEPIAAWLERVGKKVAGMYTVGSQKMVFTDNVGDIGYNVNRTKIEPFESVEEAEERGWVRMAS